MKLLIKDTFVEFVGEFMKLPWQVRKDILSEYSQGSVEKNLRCLFEDIVNDVVDPSEWKSLLKDLSSED